MIETDEVVPAEPTLDEVASAGRTALYRLYNAAGEVIYIGISDDPIGRMRGHARDQPWWDEVADKTVVWYQYREAADTAETIAIGLEQPKHNKAKRYVRLPEQAFPTHDRITQRPRERAMPDVVPTVAPVPLARPEVVLPHFRGDYSPRDWYPEFPSGWPVNLWCVSVYYESRAYDGLSFEDWMRSNGANCWEYQGGPQRTPAPLGHLRTRLAARKDGCPKIDCWVQPGHDGTWIASSGWIADDDGGGDGIGPDDPFWDDQRRFLFALKRGGRCTSVQLGRSAWAAGIADAGEARMVALIFQAQKYGHREFALRAIACLEARYRESALRRSGWYWPCDRHDIRRPRRNGTFVPAPTQNCTCWSDCTEHPECREEGSRP